MKLQIKSINDIKPNPYKIRVSDIDTIELIELGQSIRENKLYQPILIDENNQIIKGTRRYLACKKMGIEEIETLTLNNKENKNPLLINLISTLQRENLTVIEVALALKQLKDTLKVPQSELGYLVKKSASMISKFMGLLTLDQSIQDDIIENKRVLNRNVLDRLASMPQQLMKVQKEIYSDYAKESKINKHEAIYLINEAINGYFDTDIFEYNPEILFTKNSLQIKNIQIPKDKQEFIELEFMKILSSMVKS